MQRLGALKNQAFESFKPSMVKNSELLVPLLLQTINSFADSQGISSCDPSLSSYLAQKENVILQGRNMLARQLLHYLDVRNFFSLYWTLCYVQLRIFWI